MIQISNLYKSFEDKQVLKDISTTFENGKTNLIIGQSGSGKTVLMKCIVGLLTPETGHIFYDERDYVSMKKKEKTTVIKLFIQYLIKLVMNQSILQEQYYSLI